MLVQHKRRDPEACVLSRGKGDSIALGIRRILPQLQNELPRVWNSYFLPEALHFA